MYWFNGASCEGSCTTECDVCKRCTIGAREWTVTLPNGEVRKEYMSYSVDLLIKTFPGTTFTVANIAKRPEQ